MFYGSSYIIKLTEQFNCMQFCAAGFLKLMMDEAARYFV